MVSMSCHECGKVKRCQMYRDERENNRVVYFCRRCACELGYVKKEGAP